MFIECDDAIVQNGKKVAFKPCRRAIFRSKMPLDLPAKAFFARRAPGNLAQITPASSAGIRNTPLMAVF
jgi:hypothetical protein